MPLFKSKKDLKFINKINYEYLKKIIDTTANLFKLSLEQSQDNIYMESVNKYYHPGINIHCLIDHNDQSFSEVSGGITNVYQEINVRFYREMLKDADIYPEIGDVVEWNHNYYEIMEIVENQILAGRAESEEDIWNWSLICKCALQTEKNINIEHPTHTKDQSEVEYDSIYK